VKKDKKKKDKKGKKKRDKTEILKELIAVKMELK